MHLTIKEPTLKDLTRSEQRGLVGLLKAVVMADGVLTEDEEREVLAIMEEMGVPLFFEHLQELDDDYTEESDLKSLLESITRPEARELIYGSVLQSMNINILLGQDVEIMQYLAEAWDLDVRIDEEDVAYLNERFGGGGVFNVSVHPFSLDEQYAR